MKKILGLDLGTTSIGWALVHAAENEKEESRIVKMGSRIVPMDGEDSNFKKGDAQTRNAKKREKKGIRVGNKRYKQRRNKLIYVLQKLDLLPEQIKLSQPIDNPLEIDKVNVLPISKKTKQSTAGEFVELRAKAIHGKVSREEFGRILYRFNQLRGYAGGDDDDIEDDLIEVLGLKSDKVYPTQINRVQQFKIISLEKTDEKSNKKIVYDIQVEDIEKKVWTGITTIEGLSIGESIELKQTIRQNAKTGKISSIIFSLPNKTSWRKKMENMEEALEKHSEKYGRKTYVSEYFLDCLKENRWQKIRDNVILRSRYEEEFDAIWNKQFEYHLKEVKKETIEVIAKFLFPGSKETQKQYRKEALEKGLKHIIRNQIIYFQRPLKDQSHLISECRFEKGEKTVAKSHPLFQEYKIWEQINKLSITRKLEAGKTRTGKIKYKYIDRNISFSFKEYLFKELQEKKEIVFATILKKLQNQDDFVKDEDFFNGLDSKSKLVGNTTRITLKNKLGRFWDILGIDNVDEQIKLWDILYNSKGNEYDLGSHRNKAIAEYLKSKGIEDKEFDKIVIAISSIKYKRDYASISLKAVEKSLPLVRAGKYFDSDIFPEEVNERIIRLVNEVVEDPYDIALQEYLYNNDSLALTDGGFVNAHALALLYGQHTAKQISDKDVFKEFTEIKALKRHSLRNPLVEQMINETLMVIKDIWRAHGKPDVIKVELARELKNSQKERKKINDANQDARKDNLRIEKRLAELKQEISSGNIEKYKLWSSQKNTDEEFIELYESTKGEKEKMKLWEEQGHVDPYTGKVIQLSNLFDKGLYDIDHIIPKSRYFDDSMGNKVVCSTAVNKEKSNRTAMEYFDAGSEKYEILSKEDFIDNAEKKFFGKKRKHMLATKIPDAPVDRQKKDTQYISVRVKEELAKIVGSENVKTSTGMVTHYLRNHWGVTGVFKNKLEDRFVKYFEKKSKFVLDEFKKEYIKVIENEIKESNLQLLKEADYQKREIERIKNLKLGQDEIQEEYLAYIDEYMAVTSISTPTLIEFESDNIIDFIKTKLPDYQCEKVVKLFTKKELPISEDDFYEIFEHCHLFNDEQGNRIIKGYSKRYDHRHHAMDALVVACTDEKAVKRINDLNKHLQDWVEENREKFNLTAESQKERFEQFMIAEHEIRKKAVTEIKRFRNIEIPWNGFLKDFETALDSIIVSIKPKDKLIIQNKEEKDSNNNIVKTKEKTIRIRGALHEETLYGISNNAESYRVALEKFASNSFATEKNIENITSPFLRKTISEHFKKFNKKKAEAFGSEGLMILNKKLSERVAVKNGVEKAAPHPPLTSVKIYRKKEKDRQKITLQKLDREKSYNDKSYVVAGNNYLCAVMEKNEERIIDIISLFDATNLVKEEFRKTFDKSSFDKDKVLEEYFVEGNSDEKGSAEFRFFLKHYNYVYLPPENEDVILDTESLLFKEFWSSPERTKNIFVVNEIGMQMYFRPHTLSEVIEKSIEIGSKNKIEFMEGRKIISYCIPIILDRLGNIIEINNAKVEKMECESK